MQTQDERMNQSMVDIQKEGQRLVDHHRMMVILAPLVAATIGPSDHISEHDDHCFDRKAVTRALHIYDEMQTQVTKRLTEGETDDC